MEVGKTGARVEESIYGRRNVQTEVDLAESR